MRQALELALEALEEAKLHIWLGDKKGVDANIKCHQTITAIKEALAQPEQETLAWKLMPKEPTEEMLKAMDECSTEGYDERLYAGHASSVYMAAWDAQQPQPERYITDAMKVRQAVAQALLDDVYAEELEQPEAKQSGTISITMPAPIAYLCENATGHKYFRWKKPASTYKPIPLYTTPPQQEPVACVYKAITKKGETAHFGEYASAKAWAGWGSVEQVPLKTLTLISKSIEPCPTCEALARTVMLDQTSHDTTPPQRKPLTDDEIGDISKNYALSNPTTPLYFARAIEAAHGIKE